MTDGTTPTPPPVPEQSAARAAEASSARRPTYDPRTDPDDTGVPTAASGDLGDIGQGFLRALFDVSFRTFITRRLASVFYVVGLVAIAIGFLVYFVSGIANAIALFAYNIGAAVALLVATIILVPIVTFLAIVVLRFVIEAVVALIAIAENTERTAAHTRR